MSQEFTLKSGRVVFIRPMTWDEYWVFNEQKLSSLDEKPQEQTIAQRIQQARAAREAVLSACVTGWDSLKAELSLPEVVEMEKHIDALSKDEVHLGNSAPSSVQEKPSA